MSTKLFLILLVAFICLMGCKDKDPTRPGRQRKAPPHETYEIWMGEAKDYLYFKTGSVWVYKNMQSSVLDTLVCTLSKYDTVTVTGNKGFRTVTYDYLRVVTKSNKSGILYDLYSRGKNPDIVPSTSISFEKDKIPGGYGTPCFNFPFQISPGSTNLNSLNQIAKDSSVTVNGINYSNVQVFQYGQDNTYPDILDPNPNNNNFYMLCFYATGYGMIKYAEPLQNRSIELVEHHLIQ